MKCNHRQVLSVRQRLMICMSFFRAGIHELAEANVHHYPNWTVWQYIQRIMDSFHCWFYFLISSLNTISQSKVIKKKPLKT